MTTEPTFPELTPLFGARPFGADTTCRAIHPGGPIPRGSRCCCMACHRTSPEMERAIQAAAREQELREWRARAAYAADFAARVKAQRYAALARQDRKGGAA